MKFIKISELTISNYALKILEKTKNMPGNQNYFSCLKLQN